MDGDRYGNGRGAAWRRTSGLLLSGMLLSAGLAVVTAGASSASTPCTTSWTNPLGGAWSDGANWSSGVPGADADACITLPSTYTVTLGDADAIAHSLTLGGTGGKQTLHVLSSCDQGNALLTLGADSVVAKHGIVTFESTSINCYPGVTQSAGTLTNDGELITGYGETLFRGDLVNNASIDLARSGDEVAGTWTNYGTISLADYDSGFSTAATLVNDGKIEAAGTGSIQFEAGSTFTQATGKIIGTGVVIAGGEASFVGPGPGTVGFADQPSTVEGNLGKHQTLAIASACGESSVTAVGSWTNRGTILMNGDCEELSALTTNGTLTNLGTIDIGPSDGASIYLNGGFVNRGMLSICASCYVHVKSAQFTNTATGTLAIALASATSFGDISFFQTNPTPKTKLELDGTLALSTTGGYWPAKGADFLILSNAKRSGTFATVTGTTQSGQSTVLGVTYAKTGASLHAS